MRGYAEAMPNEDDISHEETTDPLVADARNFYKVEKWTRDGTKVDSLLYAGNSLGKARSVFERVKHRPRIHVTIRQQIRVLDQVPTATVTVVLTALVHLRSNLAGPQR